MIVLRKIQTHTNIVIGQSLTPNPDGIVNTFQTPHNFKSNSIVITWNGQSLYSPDDFIVLNSNTIQFVCDSVYLPKYLDVIRATYERA